MLSRTTLVAAVGLLAVIIGAQPIQALQAVSPARMAQRGGLLPGEKRISAPGGAYIDVTPLRLMALLRHKSFTLVNVHVPYAGEIARTDRFLPFDQIERNLIRLPGKTAMIVLYCRSGRMSALAARRLVRLGYTSVWELAGGMDAWRQQGLPLHHAAR